MKNLKDFIKYIIVSLLIIFLLLLLISTLYYFNLLSSNVVNYLRPLAIFLCIFIGSFISGKKHDKNGYLEGLKYGGAIIFIFLLISLFFFNDFFKLRFILYDSILLITAVLGGMIGISRRRD